MHVLIASFIHYIQCCLGFVLFCFIFCHLFPFHTLTMACLSTFVTSAGVYKNEIYMDVLLACFLLLFL